MRLLPPDAPKRAKNIERHGYDMADLTLDFFANAIVVPAKKGRHMAIGIFEERTVAVVFKRLGAEAIRPISMRRAGRTARRLYDQD